MLASRSAGPRASRSLSLAGLPDDPKLQVLPSAASCCPAWPAGPRSAMAGKRALSMGCAGVLTAAATAVILWRPGHGPVPPAVNRAQARLMLPAIATYLDSPAGGNQGGYLTGAFPQLKPRVFCTAAIIEIRRDGSTWRVGMQTACGEYARRGDTLLEGTAGGNQEVMVLAGNGGYRAVSAAASDPTVPDPRWVDQHFSAGAAAEINDGSWPVPPTRPSRQGAHSAFRHAPVRWSRSQEMASAVASRDRRTRSLVSPEGTAGRGSRRAVSSQGARWPGRWRCRRTEDCPCRRRGWPRYLA